MSVICISAPPLPYFLECGYRIFDPGQHHPNRKNHGLFNLLVVESGTLFVTENGSDWDVSAGQSLLLLPNSHHYGTRACEERTAFYWLHFHTECSWTESKEKGMFRDPTDHIERFLRYPYVIGLSKYGTLPNPGRMFSQLQQLVQLNKEHQSRSIWQQQQILENIMQAMDTRPLDPLTANIVSVSEQVEFYIRQNHQSRITAQHLSEQFHFHYNYISRCMKRVFGMTPMEYLMHYRLEEAKKALIRTDSSVAQIAEEVGFDNHSYFSKCFSERYGLTPLNFRLSYRGN